MSTFSLKVIIILGGLFVGIGWILSGYAWNINVLAITYGLMAGGGVGIVYGIPVVVISKWFPDKNENNLKVLDISTREMLTKTRFYGIWICNAIGTLIGLMAVGITSSV